MLEKIGYIKNPLTIIAIFSSLIEVCAISVLPFVSTNNQVIIVWFLVIFPVVLIAIFFLTLNFNAAALYSPSDFKDESVFLKYNRLSSDSEWREQIEKDISVSGGVADLFSSVEIESINEELFKENLNNSIYIKYQKIEKLLLGRCSEELGLETIGSLCFSSSKIKTARHVYTGFFIKDTRQHLIDIKFITAAYLGSRYAENLIKIYKHHQDIIAEKELEPILNLLCVIDSNDKNTLNNLKKLLKLLNMHDLNYRLSIYDANEIAELIKH